MHFDASNTKTKTVDRCGWRSSRSIDPIRFDPNPGLAQSDFTGEEDHLQPLPIGHGLLHACQPHVIPGATPGGGSLVPLPQLLSLAEEGVLEAGEFCERKEGAKAWWINWVWSN